MSQFGEGNSHVVSDTRIEHPRPSFDSRRPIDVDGIYLNTEIDVNVTFNETAEEKRVV